MTALSSKGTPKRAVSKFLMEEVTGCDEDGEQEFRRQHDRAAFEYTCSECQTTVRTLPPNRRGYYDEVAVIETERRAPSVINSTSWRVGSGGVSQRGSPGGSTTYCMRELDEHLLATP